MELQGHKQDLIQREKELTRAFENIEAQRYALVERERRIVDREKELDHREGFIRAREGELMMLNKKPLGLVSDILRSSDTLRSWVRYIEGANEIVLAWMYTFDLDIVATSMEAARRRGAKVQILGDKRTSKGTKGTAALYARLKKNGVSVHVREGTPLSDHYVTGNSATNISVKQNSGIMHSKVLVCDNTMLIGSCNFTTSSQCNWETVVMVNLSVEGRKSIEETFASDLQDSEEFT